MNLENKKIDRLLVIRRVGEKKGNILWECLCDCGKKVIRTSTNLNRGKNKSCGCYTKDRLHLRKQDNPKTERRIYQIYSDIKQRCYNKNNSNYKRYGGRGIKLSNEWDTFDKFELWAMNNGYKDTLTIERIDVNGDYSPSNCTWIHISKQAFNTRRNFYVEYEGKQIRLKTLCDDLNLNYNRIFSRLYRGWTIEEAISIKCLTGGVRFNKRLDYKKNKLNERYEE